MARPLILKGVSLRTHATYRRIPFTSNMAEWAWGGWALSFQAANAQDEESETNQRELRQHEADPLDGYKLPDNVKRLQQMEWPLFPTPTLASLQVSGYEMYNNSLVSTRNPVHVYQLKIYSHCCQHAFEYH